MDDGILGEVAELVREAIQIRQNPIDHELFSMTCFQLNYILESLSTISHHVATMLQSPDVFLYFLLVLIAF
jgi:hypothetical protein